MHLHFVFCFIQPVCLRTRLQNWRFQNLLCLLNVDLLLSYSEKILLRFFAPNVSNNNFPHCHLSKKTWQLHYKSNCFTIFVHTDTNLYALIIARITNKRNKWNIACVSRSETFFCAKYHSWEDNVSWRCFSTKRCWQ